MYILQEGSILRIADGANIPLDLGNRDYQEYLEWATENTAIPQQPESYYVLVDETWEVDLALLQAYKIAETRQEAYVRMGTRVEAMGENAIADLIIALYIAEMIPLPKAATSMDESVQIWNYFKTQRTWIESETDIPTLEAYEPSTDTGWPY